MPRITQIDTNFLAGLLKKEKLEKICVIRGSIFTVSTIPFKPDNYQVLGKSFFQYLPLF